MEIHKPKAAHSWGEFLIEIGTIICGILIALGLEQGIEWLHWHEQVHLTEEALLPEIQSNLTNIAERISVRPCQSQQIITLRDALLAPGEVWRAPPYPAVAGKPNPGLADVADGSWMGPGSGGPIPRIYRVPHRPWPDAAYRSALAAGVFNHMSGDRARLYGGLYYGFSLLKDFQEVEFGTIPHLTRLGFDGRLTPQERSAYVNTLGEMDNIDRFMASSGAQLIIKADKAGIRVKRSQIESRPFSRLACRAKVVFPTEN